MSSGYAGTSGTSAQGQSSPWSGESYSTYRGQSFGRQQLSPGEAALEFVREYSRERPEVVAMWAFGIGFMLGWKLKPW